MFNLSFKEALLKIATDFNLSDNSPQIEVNKYLKEDFVKTEISFNYTLKRWSKSEYQYWLDYGITAKSLRKYNVKVASFISSSKTKFFLSSKEEPIYLYLAEGSLKMYRPKSEKINK
jgi:hypothetical protein